MPAQVGPGQHGYARTPVGYTASLTSTLTLRVEGGIMSAASVSPPRSMLAALKGRTHAQRTYRARATRTQQRPGGAVTLPGHRPKGRPMDDTRTTEHADRKRRNRRAVYIRIAVVLALTVMLVINNYAVRLFADEMLRCADRSKAARQR